jgi:hypothetical protein
MATMNANERRAHMEKAIDDGGSVLFEGRLITSKAGLPSMADLAKTPQERDAALVENSRRQMALKEEEERLRKASGKGTEIPDGGGKSVAVGSQPAGK